MNETYTCAACDGIFSFDWTEEEAMAEKEENWGDMPMTDMVIVCDDCYRKIMGVT
jgi:DNA-directed RNA polymerase subunit RPC12/RpoP